MEKSRDRFLKWGSTRKKTAFSKVGSLEGGSCSMPDKASSVADGFSLKVPKEGWPSTIKHCMDDVIIPRSHKISEVNASKFGGACSGLVLPEVDLSKSKNKNTEAKCMNSRISVVRGPNVFSSLKTSDADTISCNPHDDLSSQLQTLYCCSDGKLLGGNLCERKEPFAALNILADIAVWVLENGYKSTVSRGQRQIFNPSKIVIKRAKSGSSSLPPQLLAHAHKLLPFLSEHLCTSKLDSPGCSFKRQHNQDTYQGLDDKNKGENLNVRRSKRSRSQYLNSKYPDSVL